MAPVRWKDTGQNDRVKSCLRGDQDRKKKKKSCEEKSGCTEVKTLRGLPHLERQKISVGSHQHCTATGEHHSVRWFTSPTFSPSQDEQFGTLIPLHLFCATR